MFIIRREQHNPILAPERDSVESVAAYNPSAVRTKDGVRIFYRAIGNPSALQTPLAEMSTIGTAFAEDGVHFHSREQVIAPKNPGINSAVKIRVSRFLKINGIASTPRSADSLLARQY